MHPMTLVVKTLSQSFLLPLCTRNKLGQSECLSQKSVTGLVCSWQASWSAPLLTMSWGAGASQLLNGSATWMLIAQIFNCIHVDFSWLLMSRGGDLHAVRTALLLMKQCAQQVKVSSRQFWV